MKIVVVMTMEKRKEKKVWEECREGWRDKITKHDEAGREWYVESQVKFVSD